MRNVALLAACFMAYATCPVSAQPVRVQGLVWGGNVAGGSWYLRDTPEYTGQPCYYIESNRANWGWGGASSVYGGSITRGNTRGDNGQQGSGAATSGFQDVLTITAPGIPNGASGSVTFNIAIATQYTPTVTFNPEWHHLAGRIGLGIGSGEWSSDFYSWDAYVWPGGLYRDFYETGPAFTIPPSVPVTYNFQFGVPFAVSIFGRVFTTAEGSAPPEYFELYFENRLSWGGVASLTGPGGSVAGYTIAAASGTNYATTGGVCGSTCGGTPALSGPSSAVACPSGQATFTVVPQTPQSLTYQWQIQSTPNTWANLTTGALSLPCGGSIHATTPNAATTGIGITPCPGAFSYLIRCTASNACVSATSTVATYTICVADFDDGSGAGHCDGGVGIEDLLYYLGVYDAGTSRADVDDGTGTGHPDGGVGIEDLLYYLARFDVGC